tara:strand:- start:33352 stop:34116 length:765 start_codon:yes stop_codon:yes gene_type:complete
MNLNITPPLISIKNLGLTLSGRVILQNVQFDLHAGEILSLIGPNGAGKSSLVKCIVGLWQPTMGDIKAISNLKIGYMPQSIKVDASMPITVKRFLLLGQESAQISYTIERVGLKQEILSNNLCTLSGGEWQRILLARALLRKPKLLVLDEPAQGVDLVGQAELYNLLGEIRDETGCAVLVVSHDLNLVMARTDNVICLNQHVCCYGHPEAVGKDPAFLKLFGNIPGVAFYAHHHDHEHDVHGEVIDNKEPRDNE